MAKYGLRRGENGLEIYVMCEIPNNVILIDAFAKHFDGFSIGSNDLTQLTLGVDRDSEIVAFDYDERDEGVKEMIRLAVEGCRRNDPLRAVRAGAVGLPGHGRVLGPARHRLDEPQSRRGGEDDSARSCRWSNSSHPFNECGRPMFGDVTDVLVWVFAGIAVIEGVGLVTLWVLLIRSRRKYDESWREPDDLRLDVDGSQSLNSGGGRDVVKTLWDTANLFLKTGIGAGVAARSRSWRTGRKSSGRT